VLDENYQELPRGRIGRVAYRSKGTAKEFFNDPEASVKAFRDGWYLPGDLGYVDEDGFVYITGREKDLIIRGGVNIYPYEIESALLAHPAVTEAAVVDMPSADLGEDVAAFVCVTRHVSSDELKSFCGGKLAPYKIPSRFEFVPDLPRTSMGKIDKEALKQSLHRRTEETHA
jgi:acyl-CoA synthetase (AMP-forming)/AMP-acid ligase II